MSIPNDPTSLPAIFKQMKENMKDRQTHNIKFRKEAAQKLIDGYEAMKSQFNEALRKDLGQNQFMANFLSHAASIQQAKHTIKHFETWAQPINVDTPITLGVATCSIEYEPMGLTLVISPWNYPIICSISPVVISICSGNSVILKPSQLAPYTSNALKKLFDTYMDQRYYRCIEGEVSVSRAISQLPFDMICFTGSTQTGRLVAIEAAKNLTPCLLELGGKSPTIVDQTADISNAVLRIIFGKFTNCGQTCVGVDHIYVHESIKEKFKKELLIKMKEAYGSDSLANSGDYPKIVNNGHFERLQSYLREDHKGKIIYEGKSDKKQRFMGPIVIEEPEKQSLIMKQQLFGPILPILYYNNLQSVVRQINDRPKPLAIYLFSNNSKNVDFVKKSTSSGAFVLNDAIIYLLNPDLPFGGVGLSGMGRYHGKSGFETFSNKKSICLSKPINMYPLSNRFPPYTDSKKKQMTFLLKLGGITYQGLGKGFKYILLAAGGILYYKYGGGAFPRL